MICLIDGEILPNIWCAVTNWLWVITAKVPHIPKKNEAPPRRPPWKTLCLSAVWNEVYTTIDWLTVKTKILVLYSHEDKRMITVANEKVFATTWSSSHTSWFDALVPHGIFDGHHTFLLHPSPQHLLTVKKPYHSNGETASKITLTHRPSVHLICSHIGVTSKTPSYLLLPRLSISLFSTFMYDECVRRHQNDFRASQSPMETHISVFDVSSFASCCG